MKKVITTLTALLIALAIGGTVQAGNHMGGMNGDCENCSQARAGVPVPIDQFRKFQLDTIDLRQEMMLKRFEVQRENLKATPDKVKISSLQTEIKAIQTRISSIRVQNGLPENEKRDGECGPKGGCGNNRMDGCNGGPCGSR